MSKTPDPRILTGLLLIGIILACNLPAGQTPNPETATPAPTIAFTETVTPAPLPTETLASFTAPPEFAPICEPGAASLPTPVHCHVPIAEQSSVFCTFKVPYNLIFMNAGASYDVLSEGFQCSDAGIKDGRQMVTCTGPMASSFELRVCDPACALPTVQADTTLCPQAYIFDPLRGCCTQELQPAAQNCILLSLETKSCVVDCGEYTKKSTCEKNGYACEWNESLKECQLRR